MDIATILTVRNGSTRLPGKVMKEIGGKPVMLWIVDRLKDIPGKIIVATTTDETDDPIEKVCKDNNISVYRGSINNVVERMDLAYKTYFPEAKFVFRALGDCPFIETSFVTHAAESMLKTKTEAFLWHLAPDTWPVYGAREFPYSISGWKKIVEQTRTSEEKEHVDKYFHDNRTRFKICYHEPPHTVYFRSYRLEIDWEEDFDLVDEIHNDIGITSSLSDVIRHLDTRGDLVLKNRNRVEKTGPLTTYDYTMRRSWMKSMTGKPVLLWSGILLNPPEDGVPIFCSDGKCLIGYGKDGILYSKDGHRIAGNAFMGCNCGSGRYWKEAKRRK